MSYDPEKDAKDLANHISTFVNTTSSKCFDTLIKYLAQDHRTLQQKFTGVCLAWLCHLSTLKDFDFDLRNEASVKIAKEIIEKVPDIKWGLPLI